MSPLTAREEHTPVSHLCTASFEEGLQHRKQPHWAHLLLGRIEVGEGEHASKLWQVTECDEWSLRLQGCTFKVLKFCI
jgi:hypothetical protein